MNLPNDKKNDVNFPQGWNHSVGNALSLLPCMIQRHGFDHSEFLVEGIFPLELTCVLIPFPKTLSDESTNRGLVCAQTHSIARTQKILTFMS